MTRSKTGKRRRTSGRWEFVRASKRQQAYWRKRPYTRDSPTLAQREFRYAAARAAREATGQTGLRSYGNKDIPPTTLRVAEALKGKRFSAPKTRPVPQILTQLTDALKQIGENVQSFKALNRDIVPQLLLKEGEKEKEKVLSYKKKLGDG